MARIRTIYKKRAIPSTARRAVLLLAGVDNLVVSCRRCNRSRGHRGTP
jgi:hypothetical protein